MGQLIGKKYVEEHFSKEAKQQAIHMISYLKNELRNTTIKSKTDTILLCLLGENYRNAKTL